ncbi:MAG TPA: hypothetical protein VN408_28380, partial [Actinoplanes sp.]|nr:hypothetical protein [Actinoplanes sp.]
MVLVRVTARGLAGVTGWGREPFGVALPCRGGPSVGPGRLPARPPWGRRPSVRGRPGRLLWAVLRWGLLRSVVPRRGLLRSVWAAGVVRPVLTGRTDDRERDGPGSPVGR